MSERHSQREGRGRGRGVTRRGFITTASAGALAAAAVGHAPPVPAQQAAAHGDLVEVGLRVNGRMHYLLVEPRWSLLFVLREQLGLTATKVGCDRGECGTCTVLVDGRPRYACLTLAVEAEGVEITTLEGLMRGEELGPVQRAFAEEDGFQCGYCTPGQVMAAEGLLRANAAPSEEQIRRAMSGNLCRCSAYQHIFRAVARAAELRRQGGGA